MCAECLCLGNAARSSKARMHCAASEVWPSTRCESVDAEGETGRAFTVNPKKLHCVSRNFLTS